MLIVGKLFKLYFIFIKSNFLFNISYFIKLFFNGGVFLLPNPFLLNFLFENVN